MENQEKNVYMVISNPIPETDGETAESEIAEEIAEETAAADPSCNSEEEKASAEGVKGSRTAGRVIKNLLYLLFIAVFFGMSLAPAAGMVFDLDGENAENRVLAQMPSLTVSSGDAGAELNTDFAKQFEEYLTDNFGFRQEVISLWSAMQYFIFSESAVDEVIVGNDRWLFYTETAADFEGTDLYTDRTIFRIARTVELMERYVSDSGAVFAFTAAPNKATVYPEYMPDSYSRSSVTNLSRLAVQMADAEYFIDLTKLFEQLSDGETQYYYSLDSHWNSLGALEVYRAVQENVAARLPEYEYDDYSANTDLIESVHSGDLAAMLLPQINLDEREYVPDIADNFTSRTPLTNRMALTIETSCPTAGSSLCMFRDSFGSSLIDTFSNNYSRVLYSRAQPYDLRAAIESQFGVVVVEIVERNLIELVARTPIADTPPCSAPQTSTSSDTLVICGKTVADGRITVSGVLDEEIPLNTDDCIYVEFRDGEHRVFFEAFPICDGDGACDRGFSLSIPEAELLQGEYGMYLHVGTPHSTVAYALYELM